MPTAEPTPAAPTAPAVVVVVVLKIFHNNQFRDAVHDGYRDGEHTVTHVFTYTAVRPPDAPVHRADAQLLDEAFTAFNIGADLEFGTPDEIAVAYRQLRNRSLSVSNVVALDDRFYACGPFGLQPLPQPPRIEPCRVVGTTPLGMSPHRPAPSSS